MITSFETGAVFVLKDEATATLERLGLKFAEVEKQITGIQAKLAGIVPPEFKASLLGATEQLKAMGLSTDKIAIGMGSSFTKVAADIGVRFEDLAKIMDVTFTRFGEAGTAAADRIGAAMARVDAQMAATSRGMAELSAKMEASSVGGVGASLAQRIGGGRHGNSGLHFGRVGTEVPGGHISLSGNAGLAALGVAGAAIYEAAELQDVIAKAMITGQLPIEPGKSVMDMPAGKSLAALIQRGASTSGYSIKDTGEAFLGIERMLGGVDFNTRLGVMDTLMPYAGLEARMKEGTSLKDSLESFVGMAHMVGEYRPEKLKDLAKAFAFTSINTTASLPQFEKTLSYSMPMLHNALGMDAQSVMTLTAMAQNAGITSTKSGTWIRSFFENSELGLGSTASVVKHNRALQRLGMLDDDNHVTWRKTDADGTIDWTGSITNMAGILEDRLKKLPLDERLGVLKDAYGERGGGFGALMGLKTFVEQIPIFASKLKNFTGADKALNEYSENSVIQQARQAWQDTANILADIGKTALPQVNQELKGLSDILKSLSGEHWWDAVKKLDSDSGSTIGKLATESKQALHDLLFGPSSAASVLPPAAGVRPLIPGLDMPPGFSPMAYHAGADDRIRALICGGFLDAFNQLRGGASDNALGVGGTAPLLTNAAYTTWGSGGVGGRIPAGLAATHAALSAGGASVPGHIGGMLTIGGQSFRFGSGGARGSASIPLGDYPITPGTIGSWGQAHGALGLNGNSIWDKTLGRMRAGIELHPGAGESLITEGCVAFLKSQWPEVKSKILGMIGREGHAYLHVGPNGASITSSPGSSAAARVGPPPRQAPAIVIHHQTHLDGKVVAQSTQRHLGVFGRFPTAVGGVDGHGHFANPGTPLDDVA